MLQRLAYLQTPLLRSLSHARLFHTSPWVRHSAPRKTVHPFLLADIGEGITECEVIKWSVKPFSKVQTFDPLCEVQSDKASVEITSPYDGVVKELLVKEGEIAKVGSGLCLIEVDEEQVDVEAAADLGEPAEAEATKSDDSDSPSDPLPERPKSGDEHLPNSNPSKRKHPLDPSQEGTNKEHVSDSHVLATPSVRHFARKSGISDLSVLSGTGKDGRVEKRDVEAYISGSLPSEPSQSSEVIAREEGVQIELSRTRYAMWKSMTKSLEIPHFGYSSTLDITALNEMLPTLNAHIPSVYTPPEAEDQLASVSPNGIYGTRTPPTRRCDPNTYFNRLTVLPLLLKTLSKAMQEWAVFRSSIDPTLSSSDRPSITIRPNSDIAIAVSTPTGLYIPVIQSVNTKTPYEIMGELRRLRSLGKQVPAGFTASHMPKRGATITVSNIGSIGRGEWAAPLLAPGCGVAIVAIGRAKWVTREEGNDRLEVGVSWSADHRVVEGAEMAAFVESWRSWVEQPARLIGEGR